MTCRATNEAALFWRAEARVRMWSGTQKRHNALSLLPHGEKHEKEFLEGCSVPRRRQEGATMDVVNRCCCGLDVHKDTVTACVAWAAADGKKRHDKREFGTATRELLALADWLRTCGVTHVAMESTGVYWQPVWHVLEGHFELLLVNAQHVKAIPGKKTDRRDSVWLAELLQHGLLRSSVVPPAPIRELRDLTRYRVTLCQECNRIANRIQQVLEDANVKLASVASDPLGASGRAMLKALIAGEADATKLADLARGLLRRKLPALQAALDGRVTAHHRFLLGELLDHLEFVEGKSRRLEATIEERLRPCEDTVQRLCTIPGVDRVSAWGIISEIGLNMGQFPDARHLASWAGLCPGNWESAGKRTSGRIRKGSAWLRRHLCQCAWAVSTKRHTYLSALFRRLAARRGVTRASIAVAHAILTIAYRIIRDGSTYRDLGPHYFDTLDPARLKRKLVKRLEGLGFQVTLAAPPCPA
jgi:transposase